MAPKNFDAIKKEIKKAVAAIIEVPETKLADNVKFIEDLGIDSMMALEIVASIEKKYKVIIPEEEIPKMRCLQDIYNALETKL